MTHEREVARHAVAEDSRELVLRPAVDIYEDPAGITLTADMPGVSRDRLEIRVEQDTLSVEGSAQLQLPEGMEALYADVPATRYRRSFALSTELDMEGIEAKMKDGVLSIHIPKRAEVQPRRIKVQVG